MWLYVCMCVRAWVVLFAHIPPCSLCVCVCVSRSPTDCDALWKPIRVVRARCAESLLQLFETLVVGMMWSLLVNVFAGVGSTQSKQVRTSVVFFSFLMPAEMGATPGAAPHLRHCWRRWPSSLVIGSPQHDRRGKENTAVGWYGWNILRKNWHSMSCHADLIICSAGGIHKVIA